MIDYIKLIENSNVYDAAIVTPLTLAKKISDNSKNNIFLKREDLQPVFSFKIRGAYNKIYSLTTEQKKICFITASAGNHAQGVAFSAKRLGISAVVVMPETTPKIKIDAVSSYGSKVVLFGESYSDAAAHAELLSKTSKASYIHPFDDPQVIAGQGTIALEILEQFGRLEQSDRPVKGTPDLIFVCIGGGGLAAGIATYIKHKSPNTKVIGVQADDSNAMARSIDEKTIVTLDEVGIFADGVAVKTVGKETFRLCQLYLDEIILVNTDEICSAIKDVFEDTRVLLEPAGALAVAGAKQYLKKNKLLGLNVVVTASGANVNFDRLRHVSERTEFAERRESVLAINLTERSGILREFCATLGARNITEFNYRLSHKSKALLYVGISIKDAYDLEALMRHLAEKNYHATDLTDNETAKLHVRHMIGGHAQKGLSEVLYRFQFPEKPGALMTFLRKMDTDWNISLFHYRNHGADFGRVLCGLQIPSDSKKQFQLFLQSLQFPYFDETDNVAYKLFLS
jgi:threonine dehydratase